MQQIVNELQFWIAYIRRPILVVFGGGSSDFRAAAQRVRRQARASKKFGKIYAFSETNLPGRRKFYSTHNSFIQENPRGFGLYIWKPYIINWVQHRHQKNRIIIYLDAGVYLNLSSDSARKRFDDYLRIAWRNKLLAFQLNPGQFAEIGFPDLREKSWNRSDLLDELGIIEKQREASQIEAGIILIRNSVETQEFTKQWLHLMQDNDYRFLREPGRENQPPGFIEHRFDQAVFSALLKSREYETLANENWFHPDWFSRGSEFPFWCVRMRKG